MVEKDIIFETQKKYYLSLLRYDERNGASKIL